MKVIIVAFLDDLLFITIEQIIIDEIKKLLDKYYNFKYLEILKDYLTI